MERRKTTYYYLVKFKLSQLNCMVESSVKWAIKQIKLVSFEIKNNEKTFYK